jgi:hypothetical protein
LDYAVIGIAAALIIAGALSFIELITSLMRRLSRKAWPWVALRLILDGGTGGLAYLFVANVMHPAGSADFARSVLIAGFGAPTVLRSQVIHVGQTKRPFGLLPLFNGFRDKIDKEIDVYGSTAECQWLFGDVIPKLRHMPVNQLGDRTVAFLAGLHQLSTADRNRAIRYVRGVVKDRSTSDDVKRQAIVLRLREWRYNTFVQSLLADATE